MPLRRIRQTSKTLLLEEFCSSESVPDLYTILRNEDVEQKSEFNRSIEDNLEVRSYEEFVNKFMPSVWEWMEQSQDPSCPVKFCYSLEKPDGISQAHEMKLSNNEFYAMVMDLYSKKGTSGNSNLEFDYTRVSELLSPSKVMENAKQLRKDLQYNYNKMLELGESAKAEKNECIRKIKEIRKEIVSQYKDSFTGKIKLALADTESKLAALPDKQKKMDNALTEDYDHRLPCKAEFDENGDVKIIQIEDNQTVIEDDDAAVNENQLAVWINKDFDKFGGEQNDYIRSLVVSNYCGDSSAIVQLDRSELIRKRNQYTAIYKASQEQFIRAISSAVEKILDVKVFFEQASIPGRKLPAPVIVANCKANKLVEDEKVKARFEYYIKETSADVGEYRIWFAIVPAIGDIDFVDKPDIEVDLDDLDLDDEENDHTVKTQDGDTLVGTSSLKAVLKILQEGRITTFFNYRANEKTGFGRLSSSLLEQYRKKLESIEGNPYAAFCYPNFTVLPKKETVIEIGKTGIEGVETKEYMDIPGIYVDSSYVAAGLAVATQNPAYLEKKGYKVNPNNPCVRFDLEDEDNRFIMLTNMNREGKGDWATEIADNIGSDKFGFCFCGNTIFHKGERVNNSYVYVTRNMRRDEKGEFEPLFTRLTMDFVMQYLKTEHLSIGGNNRFKISVIQEFKKEKVEAWKREADSEIKANSILRNGEDILFDDADHVLKMKFNRTAGDIALDIVIAKD